MDEEKCSALQPSAVNAMQARFPSLRRLSLWGRVGFMDACLPLLQQVSALDHLTLNVAMLFGSHEVPRGSNLAALTQVRSLKLCAWDVDGMMWHAQALTRLTALHVAGCRFERGLYFVQLTALQSLSRLTLENCEDVVNDGLEHISLLTTLQIRIQDSRFHGNNDGVFCRPCCCRGMKAVVGWGLGRRRVLSTPPAGGDTIEHNSERCIMAACCSHCLRIDDCTCRCNFLSSRNITVSLPLTILQCNRSVSATVGFQDLEFPRTPFCQPFNLQLLQPLTQLTRLTLSHAGLRPPSRRNGDPLRLPALKALDIRQACWHPHGAADMPVLAGFVCGPGSLREVALGCDDVANYQPLRDPQLSAVTKLTLCGAALIQKSWKGDFCDLAHDLPALRALQELELYALEYADSSDMATLESLPSLRRLVLSRCPRSEPWVLSHRFASKPVSVVFSWDDDSDNGADADSEGDSEGMES